MRITPNIVSSELVGTKLQVSGSRHQAYLGIKGEVIDETRNTLTLIKNGKTKRIIKDQAIFNLTFSDGTVVEIDGRLLVGRPEDRLKKNIKRLW